MNLCVLTQYFYPRSPCGERRQAGVMQLPTAQFLSTLSLRRATNNSLDSILAGVFLSTLSLRRATVNGGVLSNSSINFYPRSPCGERLFNRRFTTIDNAFLSTLSLRRATYRDCTRGLIWRISIHALLAESDRRSRHQVHLSALFLSTLSLRRATMPPSIARAARCNFYPRSPCGERPGR